MGLYRAGNKMTKMYDSIIVGAGPAGATAAFFLGAAGQRVLVLDKATLPRYKPCGGGISVASLKQFPFSFDPVIEARVESVAYALHDQIVTTPLPPGTILMVMRDRFDAHILAHANAEVRQGTAIHAVIEQPDRVIIETRDGASCAARFLIGADGANSVVAREVGLWHGRVLVAAIEAEVSAPPDVMRQWCTMPLFAFGELAQGYLWIFPKADHLSVGIAGLHPKPGELQATLARVMARYGVSVEGAKLYGHPLPIYTSRQPIATRRTLLVGDAAGLVDPLTGEGIRFAIKSGKLAAQALLAGRPEVYQKLVQRHIGRSHRLGLALSLAFYHHQRSAFTLGVQNPFATRAFVDLLTDRAHYAQVIARLFCTLPLFGLMQTAMALAGVVDRPLCSTTPQSRLS